MSITPFQLFWSRFRFLSNERHRLERTYATGYAHAVRWADCPNAGCREDRESLEQFTAKRETSNVH